MVAAVAGVLAASSAFGQYVYDYATTSYSFPTIPQFVANGSVTSSVGLTQFGGGGGSQIYLPTVSGANANDYEVNSKLVLTAGGATYVHFLRASTNAQASAGGCTGDYVSVEIVVPTWYTSGGAAGLLNVNKCTAGALSSLYANGVTLLSGSDFRTVVFGGSVWVFVDSQLKGVYSIPVTTGHPGFGGYGMSGPAGFSAVSIGHHDTVNPGAPSSTGIRSSILPTQVSFAWQGASDDVNGVGVCGYLIFRDSLSTGYVGLAPGAEYSDSSLSAGLSYSYWIASVDFHGNVSPPTSVNITTPPATAVDPKRTGVLSTGSYWGGGGEQIDMLSGNLNFSLPLVSAKGRTGWSVPVGLSYNSQNWRNDSGITTCTRTPRERNIGWTRIAGGSGGPIRGSTCGTTRISTRCISRMAVSG